MASLSYLEFVVKKYMCVICGFIYNEAKGIPKEGIQAGTRWEDIPLTWTCPDCGASKMDFEMVEIWIGPSNWISHNKN